MYKPHYKNKEILERALEHINSVPYNVSLRWVFYRLLQENIYTKKEDYANWKGLSSKARKSYFDGWYPSIFIDDKRQIIYQNFGERDEYSARQVFFDDIKNIFVFLDHFYRQKNIIIVMFESQTMASQFTYYCERIDLIPFSGDPSLSLKWDAAKRIQHLSRKYNKSVTVLYFGDLDKKGLQIIDSAFEDITEWCDKPFNIERCGITKKQATKYKLPEKIGTKGETYEWESLSDFQAKEVITDSLNKYIDFEIIKNTKEEEEILTEKYQREIKNLLF